VQFLDSMSALTGSESAQAAEGGAGGQSDQFGASIDTEFLSMLFFHAVTIQALISAIVAGYIRNVDLVSGVKYAIPLATIALVVWVLVEAVSGGGGEAAVLLLVGSTGWSLDAARLAVARRSLGALRSDRVSGLLDTGP
jgi:flagellar protein FlaJ